MASIQPISYPPKSAFGFFSTVPFWGANSRFRKMVRRQLVSRAPFKAEIDAMSSEELEKYYDKIIASWDRMAGK